jgi:hypothetical protein
MMKFGIDVFFNRKFSSIIQANVKKTRVLRKIADSVQDVFKMTSHAVQDVVS